VDGSLHPAPLAPAPVHGPEPVAPDRRPVLRAVGADDLPAGPRRYAPAGDLDIGTVHRLRLELHAFDPRDDVVVVLDGVPFCDVEALRELTRSVARHAAAGGSVRFLDPLPPVRRSFELVGLRALVDESTGRRAGAPTRR
jgi:anti-anti-sigma regulatory factor